MMRNTSSPQDTRFNVSSTLYVPLSSVFDRTPPNQPHMVLRTTSLKRRLIAGSRYMHVFGIVLEVPYPNTCVHGHGHAFANSRSCRCVYMHGRMPHLRGISSGHPRVLLLSHVGSTTTNIILSTRPF